MDGLWQMAASFCLRSIDGQRNFRIAIPNSQGITDLAVRLSLLSQMRVIQNARTDEDLHFQKATSVIEEMLQNNPTLELSDLPTLCRVKITEMNAAKKEDKKLIDPKNLLELTVADTNEAFGGR